MFEALQEADADHNDLHASSKILKIKPLTDAKQRQASYFDDTVKGGNPPQLEVLEFNIALTSIGGIVLLLLRRLPALLLLYRPIPPLQNFQEGAFVGWFGPIGVAAIFYAGLCIRRTGIEQVWAVSSLMVCASIIAHSLSATPLTRAYGQYAQNQFSKGNH